MKGKFTIFTLRDLLRDLKSEALRVGGYTITEQWERRDKKKARRCMGYNRLVRQINCLEAVIKRIETDK